MKRTGSSWTTLNDYIASGVLPKPVVKESEPGAGQVNAALFLGKETPR